CYEQAKTPGAPPRLQSSFCNTSRNMTEYLPLGAGRPASGGGSISIQCAPEQKGEAMHFKSTVHIHPPSPWSRWLLLPLLALMLLLTACGGSGDSSKSDDQARATVLVYVVGSDLEDEADMATGNLEEMMKVGSSQD